MNGRIRVLQHTERARVEHDLVLTRLGELDRRNNDMLIQGNLYGLELYQGAVLYGLKTTAVGIGLQVNVSAPASLILKNNGIFSAIDDHDDANYNVVFNAAHASLDRIDTIEATIKKRSAFTDTGVDVVYPETRVVVPETRDRDFEYYIDVQKKTGTPAASPVPATTTPATAGEVTGTVSIPTTIDLSAQYIINLSVGYGKSFVSVDCRGATPAATTKTEIITALNGAGFGSIATIDGNFIKITAPGTGENSIIKFKQPNDPATDALYEIMGISENLGYYTEYKGTLQWIKIAEVRIPAAATVLTASQIKSRENKSDWLTEASFLLNGETLQSHREMATLDHPDASVEYRHLSADAKVNLKEKLTKYRGTNAKLYAKFGDGTGRCGSVYRFSDVPISGAAGEVQTQQMQEQVYPLSRVDNKQETISGPGYAVPTTITEGAGHIIPFTPTPSSVLLFSLNHNRVGVYVNSVGSGWDKLEITIHNASHTNLGFAEILYANVIVGWNYVNIPLPLSDGQTYHYHIRVTGFTSGSTPTIATDSSNNKSYRQMYKPDGGKFGGASWSDVIKVLDSVGANLVPSNASTDDDITTPGTGYAGETDIEIMAVNFSDPVYWQNWSYNNYVGVDLLNGRVKLPPAYNISNYFIEFNTNIIIDSIDTKSILRHNDNLSLEDWIFRNQLYDYTVYDQESFNNLFTRVSANNYYVKDSISKVIFKDGTYNISGLVQGGDTNPNLTFPNTTQCSLWECIGGNRAVINYDNYGGGIVINKNNVRLAGISISGNGVAITSPDQSSFYISSGVTGILFDDCETYNRVGTGFRGFNSAGAQPDTKLSNCKSSIRGSGSAAFYQCNYLDGCTADGVSRDAGGNGSGSYGFQLCYRITNCISKSFNISCYRESSWISSATAVFGVTGFDLCANIAPSCATGFCLTNDFITANGSISTTKNIHAPLGSSMNGQPVFLGLLKNDVMPVQFDYTVYDQLSFNALWIRTAPNNYTVKSGVVGVFLKSGTYSIQSLLTSFGFGETSCFLHIGNDCLNFVGEGFNSVNIRYDHYGPTYNLDGGISIDKVGAFVKNITVSAPDTTRAVSLSNSYSFALNNYAVTVEGCNSTYRRGVQYKHFVNSMAAPVGATRHKVVNCHVTGDAVNYAQHFMAFASIDNVINCYNVYCNYGFASCTMLYGCISEAAQRGFDSCYDISSSQARGCTLGFYLCYDIAVSCQCISCATTFQTTFGAVPSSISTVFGCGDGGIPLFIQKFQGTFSSVSAQHVFSHSISNLMTNLRTVFCECHISDGVTDNFHASPTNDRRVSVVFINNSQIIIDRGGTGTSPTVIANLIFK